MDFTRSEIKRFREMVTRLGITPTRATVRLGYSKRHMRELVALARIDDRVRPNGIFTDELGVRLKNMVESGMTLRDACHEAGLDPRSYPTIRRFYAKKWGIDMGERKVPLKERFTGASLGLIEIMLTEHKNVAKVAIMLGVNHQAFLRFVKQVGLDRFVRPQPPAYTEGQRKTIIRMWKMGHSFIEIGRALGRENGDGMPTLIRRWLGEEEYGRLRKIRNSVFQK